MQILILGMHRSGTSMVARLLNMLGCYLAPEGFSSGANQENPKGFWERRDVRNLNDMVLHSADADWHRLSTFSLGRVPPQPIAQFKKEAGKLTLAMDAHRPWVLKGTQFASPSPYCPLRPISMVVQSACSRSRNSCTNAGIPDLRDALCWPVAELGL